MAFNASSAVNGNATNYEIMDNPCLHLGKGQFYLGSVISTLGIIGNAAFMFVVLRVPSMRTVTNAYLVNLAVADLLHLSTHLFMWVCILYDPEKCRLDMLYCYLLLPSRVSQYVSMFTVTMLSVERYLAMCKPLVYRNGVIHKKRFVQMVIVAIWALSTILVIGTFISCTDDTIMETVQIVDGVLFLICVGLLMATVLTIYVVIIKQVRQSSNSVKSHEKQIIRVCLVTALVYFVCTIPSVFGSIFLLMSILSSQQICRVKLTVNMSTIFLEVNSAVNPLIYNALSSNYRKAFGRAFGFISARHNQRSGTLTGSTRLNDGNDTRRRKRHNSAYTSCTATTV
ncbi:somatostatin receptor type 2-like [Saccoglossus kowalevskii]|uniref:Kappa-type opioid receptor-like n=1 Tax=Saccoglossus kowalevskii TaxID=10224 RepID=A0ABM0MGP8_SACKO|nr:PREDICTED: kappa-type opioid receptor-like [Saccoglossus kowalevskii]